MMTNEAVYRLAEDVAWAAEELAGILSGENANGYPFFRVVDSYATPDLERRVVQVMDIRVAGGTGWEGKALDGLWYTLLGAADHRE